MRVFPHFLVVRMKGVGVLPVGAPTGPGVRGLGEGLGEGLEEFLGKG